MHRRLALAAGSKNGGDPPAGKVRLDIAGWVSKDDLRPEAQQKPIAYTVHKDWRGPNIDNWLFYRVVGANGDVLRDYPEDFPYKPIELPSASEGRPLPIVHLWFDANHRLVFLLDKATDGLLLERNSRVHDYKRLFDEIDGRLFPVEDLGSRPHLRVVSREP